MAEGPGKYDEACTMVREVTDASIAMVIVCGGRRGDGFSLQVDATRSMALRPAQIAKMLRSIANQIEGV